MPTARRLLAAVAVLVAVALGLATPAFAEDAPPGPTTTTAPTPTPEAGPAGSDLPLREGSSGPRVALAQERLAWLGYPIAADERNTAWMGRTTVAATRRFQLKFGPRLSNVIDLGTWNMLRRKAGAVGVLPAPCLGEATICIDKSPRLLRFVVDGKVALTLDARFGFLGADTREGTFRVSRKSRHHVSSVYRTSMPFSLFFSGGQAIHYSRYFARDGYFGASHGCVNLRDFDRTRWLYDRVRVGTRVFLYAS